MQIDLSSDLATGLFFALGACILFGVADFVVGQFGKKITPQLILSVLYIIEIPIVFIAVLLFSDFGELVPNLWLFFFGSLSTFGFFVFIHGLTHGKTTIVAPLTGLLALIVPAIFAVVIQDVVSVLVWIGMFIAAIAILLITKEVQPELVDQKIEQKKVLRYSIISGTVGGLVLDLDLACLDLE